MITAPLILSDQKTCIGASGDLKGLAEDLATHATHLEVAKASLPKLAELNGLVNACRSPRFGGEGDRTMTAYLRHIRLRIMQDADRLTRISNANEIHAELATVCEGLRMLGVNEIYHVNHSLRGMHGGFVPGAKEKNAIEAAAIAVPVNQRANLIAHLQKPKVCQLLNALARNYSGLGLGDVAVDPMSGVEY